jgi:hypothetical protein
METDKMRFGRTFRSTPELRRAVSRGDWGRAEEALGALRQEVEALWSAASTNDERRALREETFQILEWARRTAFTDRAHARDSLLRLERQDAYQGRTMPRDAVQLDG